MSTAKNLYNGGPSWWLDMPTEAQDIFLDNLLGKHEIIGAHDIYPRLTGLEWEERCKAAHTVAISILKKPWPYCRSCRERVGISRGICDSCWVMTPPKLQRAWLRMGAWGDCAPRLRQSLQASIRHIARKMMVDFFVRICPDCHRAPGMNGAGDKVVRHNDTTPTRSWCTGSNRHISYLDVWTITGSEVDG